MIANSKDVRYEVLTPFNEWDTNYRVYDELEGITYLIDIHDVYDNVEDMEEHEGILHHDLLNVEIAEIKSIAWKTEKDDFY